MKFERKSHSFRSQLLRVTSIFILIPLLLFIGVFQNLKGIISKQYSQAAQNSVVAIGNNIDYILKDVEELSNTMLTNRDMMKAIKNGDTDQLKAHLYNHYLSNLHIEGIYLITSSGYHYRGNQFSDGVKSFPRESLQDTTGEIIWLPTRDKPVKLLSGTVIKKYLSMGRKIVDVNSLQELGYMSIELDAGTLTEAFSVTKENQSRIFVCNSQGTIITSSDNDFTPLDKSKDVYFQNMIDGENVSYKRYKEQGKKYVAIYASLNNGTWYIVQTIPEAILYADIGRMQLYVFAGFALLLAAIFTLLTIYSRRVTKPIEKMRQQMKEVEEGNMNVRVESNAYNELDDLSDSFNHMVGKIQTLMEENVLAEQNKNEMELEVLHAQINPHFLYNTLNTIRWMAKIKKEDRISDALVALVKLLRVSISFGKNMIYLEEEIGYIENYLLIQKLRFNQLFEVHIDIQEEHKKINIPKLILQPIVENSLIYGIDEADERIAPIIIRIWTRKQADYIQIILEDNGDGIAPEILDHILKKDKDINRFSKVGLNNVNQRIKMHLGEDYGLKIISNPGMGTRVTISVPDNTEQREEV